MQTIYLLLLQEFPYDQPPGSYTGFKLGWGLSQDPGAAVLRQDLRASSGWPRVRVAIIQGTVRPYRMVFPPPALYQDLGILQGIENLPSGHREFPGFPLTHPGG